MQPEEPAVNVATPVQGWWPGLTGRVVQGRVCPPRTTLSASPISAGGGRELGQFPPERSRAGLCYYAVSISMLSTNHHYPQNPLPFNTPP